MDEFNVDKLPDVMDDATIPPAVILLLITLPDEMSIDNKDPIVDLVDDKLPFEIDVAANVPADTVPLT